MLHATDSTTEFVNVADFADTSDSYKRFFQLKGFKNAAIYTSKILIFDEILKKKNNILV